MRKNLDNILSVIPGSKFLGIAVFYKTDLNFWAVKSVIGKTLEEKEGRVTSMLSNVIKRYGIECLIIKKLHPSRSSDNLNRLVTSIKNLAREFKLEVVELTINEIKDKLQPGRKATKKSLMEEVTQIYPVLYNEMQRQTEIKNRYHIPMFEAVALAIAANSRIESGLNPKTDKE